MGDRRLFASAAGPLRPQGSRPGVLYQSPTRRAQTSFTRDRDWAWPGLELPLIVNSYEGGRQPTQISYPQRAQTSHAQFASPARTPRNPLVTSGYASPTRSPQRPPQPSNLHQSPRLPDYFSMLSRALQGSSESVRTRSHIQSQNQGTTHTYVPMPIPVPTQVRPRESEAIPRPRAPPRPVREDVELIPEASESQAYPRGRFERCPEETEINDPSCISFAY
ncbi:hypothetical protein GMRT_10815 [Giardia muris]|uniref:Uncharacterized protein n=1 Tax=Giardia muris TaxID=5742 RepID=A0A4Z1SNX4_GIAMU|nr:hypothetical protein GMRT_10815 [Giardia muris]|eukprot:TNJ27512.1 hypothetical protein GMRT_10815 [Giardia muris]